jgi:RNA polymerase sigma factor for flagellar operon FliA
LEATSATLATGRRPTAAEAERLWKAWATNRDARARDHLVLSYSPMVRYLAIRKVRELPTHCDLDDLVSCGLLALVAAVDRFDPAKGATFEQYAWTRVSGAIVDELRRQDWAPRSVRRVGREIERTREKLTVRNGATPTDADVAHELAMTSAELRDRVEDVERASLVSLNASARGAADGVPLEIGETLEAEPGEHDPELAVLSQERGETLRSAIAGLSEREQKVLTLFHVHKLPGAEIGRELGVTESRVSQILAGIRVKLRERLETYDRDPRDAVAA